VTKVTSVYSKEFSYIPNLQALETVNYCLCTTKNTDFTAYGIDIYSCSGSENSFETQKKDEAELKIISNSKDFVLKILKYLYENSIKPDTAKYIILDIINKYKLSTNSKSMIP